MISSGVRASISASPETVGPCIFSKTINRHSKSIQRGEANTGADGGRAESTVVFGSRSL